MKIVPLMQLINDERQTFLGNAELLYLIFTSSWRCFNSSVSTISEVS